MTKSIRQKTANGLFWSFTDNLLKQGAQFIVGIILARLLSPREFGLVGMLTFFIVISQTFIDSGFTSALIRKTDCTQTDYSTVFIFNLGISILLYCLLFICSGFISSFFKEPQLQKLLQVLGLGLIINAMSTIQQTILIKRIDFKLQAKISILSSFASGAIGIGMAYYGCGVWSLVGRTLSGFFITSSLLWFCNNWKPSLTFSKSSFKQLFGFGSKILASKLIDSIYQNSYLLIIGKFFSVEELGFYTRADQFKALPSQEITSVIQSVTYPVMVNLDGDPKQFKIAFKKLLKSCTFITFLLMLGMAAIAKPMVMSLLGLRWIKVVDYLQLLCFVALFYPIHVLNLNILSIKGRSDLYLKLEIVKKILAIPTIVIGVLISIKAMIIGMFLTSFIAFFINSFWSGRLIGYNSIQQLKDILPGFLLSFFINGIVYAIGQFLNFSPTEILVIEIITALLLTFILCEFIQFSDYIYIKELVLEKIKKKKKERNAE